jgi:hypothetical protein
MFVGCFAEMWGTRLIFFSTSDEYKGELEIPVWGSAFGFVEESCSDSKLPKLFDGDSQPSISFQFLPEIYIKRISSKNLQDILKSVPHTRETGLVFLGKVAGFPSPVQRSTGIPQYLDASQKPIFPSDKHFRASVRFSKVHLCQGGALHFLKHFCCMTSQGWINKTLGMG